MPADQFECINCSRVTDAADAARLSRPARVGWFVLRGGQAASACPACKETVTSIGTRVALFVAVLGGSFLLYAMAKWSHLL